MQTVISYRKIGTEVDGQDALVRSELAPYVAVIFALVKIRTGVDLFKLIVQAKGGAAASAGTHSDGAAIDFRVWGLSLATIRAVVAILRECGFSATWYRDWDGNEHIHAAANLGTLSTRVLYQVRAVIAGYDGLGNGYQGRDTHPAPSQWRTIQQGAAWAASQILQEENDMAATAEELIEAFMAYPITANGKKASFAQHFAELVVFTKAQSVAVNTEMHRDNAQTDEVLDAIAKLATRLDTIATVEPVAPKG